MRAPLVNVEWTECTGLVEEGDLVQLLVQLLRMTHQMRSSHHGAGAGPLALMLWLDLIIDDDDDGAGADWSMGWNARGLSSKRDLVQLMVQHPHLTGVGPSRPRDVAAFL
jgi:hypothetical protein